MNVILQDALPAEMAADKALPGVAPCAADDWLRVDEAYGAQMRYRAALIAEKRGSVIWSDPNAGPALAELLDEVLALIPQLGFAVTAQKVICPDERSVVIDRADPLFTLGHLMQEDLCILQKDGDEHVLSAAVLCFPANWRLLEKVGRPLSTIHIPVDEYDQALARRVQRMFDGVQRGRPLWRNNWLQYTEADLHQPRRKLAGPEAPFIRAERQCILRLPETSAVVFSIHTWVVRAETQKGRSDR